MNAANNNEALASWKRRDVLGEARVYLTMGVTSRKAAQVLIEMLRDAGVTKTEEPEVFFRLEAHAHASRNGIGAVPHLHVRWLPHLESWEMRHGRQRHLAARHGNIITSALGKAWVPSEEIEDLVRGAEEQPPGRYYEGCYEAVRS